MQDSESTSLISTAMAEARRLAAAAGRLGNVPVGAVALFEGRVVGRAGNLRDTLGDPTAHAELLALREASQRLGQWRLNGVVLVVTLEPCAMCAAAIAQARIDKLVYGAAEPKLGGVDSRWRLLDASGVQVVGGVETGPCRALVTDFFASLRSGRDRTGRRDVESWPSG